jgi:hypothetical protein
MPMTPFMDRFPEVGPAETRSVKVTGDPHLPDGEYGFFEFYCNEPGCDCRRVTIWVLRPETGWRKVWATISYGWESPDFYRKWSPGQDPHEMQGASLDTLNAQSQYSSALLDLFQTVLISPGYVERLKRHYQMFRASVDQAGGPRARHEVNRLQSRRTRLRDPRRRGKR